MKTKPKLIISAIIFVLGGVLNLFFSTALHSLLTRTATTLKFLPITVCLQSLVSSKQHSMLFLLIQGFFLLLAVLFFTTNLYPYKSDLEEITPDIKTPKAVGQFQHGSARWLSDAEKNRAFSSFVLNPHDKEIKRLIDNGYEDIDFMKPERSAEDESTGTPEEVYNPQIPDYKRGGIVIGKKAEGDSERIYYVGEDSHLLCIGATRSGKSRCLVIPSICSLGLAGESIVVSDPKAELYHYCSDYLRKLGYEVLVLDFKTPAKSQRYNLLQPIIDAIERDDTDRAEMLAWDLTNNLVGKPTGEKIWTNGECSIIAAAILCVVCDNRKRPELQNMTNVYWFISEMCKTIGGKMPILEYVKKLPNAHPARALLSISDVAPSRTRGSFYTSALTTLRLFTSKSIYAITHESDFSLSEVGTKKQALFIILPDEKTTFYPIASLIVSQQYEMLAEAADKRGGRLKRRVNFVLDEYGNFTPISDMTNKLTVAAGRGMRYSLFIQSFSQLKEKYDENVSDTIKSNCQTWVYLQADDPETLREVSDKLGSYTTSSYQLSANHAKFTMPSSSHSINLTERKLLNTDEVRRVKRPFQIITSRNHPAMMYSPDLSLWNFNKMLGLGDEEHNRRVREERENKRPVITDTKQEIVLWNIWVYYQKDIMRRLAQQKTAGVMPGMNDD